MRTAATTAAVLAALANTVQSVKQSRTFAVLGFHNLGNAPLVEACVDPVVNPGVRAAHAHTVMGASNFNTVVDGQLLRNSNCTNANIPGDMSVYWAPKLYFQDPKTKKFEDVSLYYAKVYYFFEPTDDDIVPFPSGLHMLTGDMNLRHPPKAGGNISLDPEDGQINPVQWTCPQANIDKAVYPPNSDGTKYGIKNSAPGARDFGAGFPVEKCDRQFSPLRADMHFPSCYNPKKGVKDYKNSLAWPSRKYQKNGSGRANCPPGYIHMPHLFYEFYWNTPAFHDRWEVDGKTQPFVLSNGDRTGYSLHGDFVAAWDEKLLADIIANCNAGTLGMDKCVSGLDIRKLPDCTIDQPITDKLTGVLDKLPCNNPISGWGVQEPGSAGSPGHDPEAGRPIHNDPQPSVAPSFTSQKPKPSATASAPGDEYGPGPGPIRNGAGNGAAPHNPEPTNDNSDSLDAVTVWETNTVYVTSTVEVDEVLPTPPPRAKRTLLHNHRRHGRHA